jgi:hypothetical protein
MAAATTAAVGEGGSSNSGEGRSVWSAACVRLPAVCSRCHKIEAWLLRRRGWHTAGTAHH